MQFSVRNLCYVVWLQRNHMGSLRSGVEPFILCAEFSNVDISKIAVMATLTVNLLHPCNVSLSRSSFSFCSRGPAFRDKLSGLIERSRQEGERAQEPILAPARMGGELSQPCREARSVSLAGLKLSGLSCSTVVSGRPQGHEVLGMEMLISGGRLSLPWSPPSRGTGHWGKSNRNNTLLSLHMQLGLLPHGKRGEWSFPWGVWCLTLGKLGHRDGHDHCGKLCVRLECVWLFHYRAWPKARTHGQSMFLSAERCHFPGHVSVKVITAKLESLRDCDHFVHPCRVNQPCLWCSEYLVHRLTQRRATVISF